MPPSSPLKYEGSGPFFYSDMGAGVCTEAWPGGRAYYTLARGGLSSKLNSRIVLRICPRCLTNNRGRENGRKRPFSIIGLGVLHRGMAEPTTRLRVEVSQVN